MIRNFKYIAAGLTALCSAYAYGTVHTDHAEIELDAYNAIKTAVFAKKGIEYAAQFDALYPEPSEAGVIALSQEFDAGSCAVWYETYPPQSTAYINGEAFHITGKI